MSLLRQTIRLVAFLLYTCLFATLQALALLLPLKDRYLMARCWHRGAAAIVGAKVHVKGQAEKGRVLFLANHMSHLDIAVIGGVIPASRFVSRQGIKNWPFFGQLALLQNTIFIDNLPKPSSLRKARIQIQKALSQGERLIVFPEGQNTIGNVVLPFRKGLLEGQVASDYRIQPVAIHCVAVNGKAPETVADYEVYGWGDMSFALHLWRFMGYKKVDVEVAFLPPLAVGDDGMIDKIVIEQAELAVRDTALGEAA